MNIDISPAPNISPIPTIYNPLRLPLEIKAINAMTPKIKLVATNAPPSNLQSKNKTKVEIITPITTVYKIAGIKILLILFLLKLMELLNIIAMAKKQYLMLIILLFYPKAQIIFGKAVVANVC